MKLHARVTVFLTFFSVVATTPASAGGIQPSGQSLTSATDRCLAVLAGAKLQGAEEQQREDALRRSLVALELCGATAVPAELFGRSLLYRAIALGAGRATEDEAVALLEQAVDVLKGIDGADPTDLIESLERLANERAGEYRHREAFALLERSQELREEHFGFDSSEAIGGLLYRALVHDATGDRAGAEAVCHEAIARARAAARGFADLHSALLHLHLILRNDPARAEEAAAIRRELDSLPETEPPAPLW